MTDQIEIKDLLLRTHIGVTEAERRDRQDVLINLALETDTRAAGLSDDVNDTVNYRTLNKRLIAHVEGTTFNLVEKLAEDLAALCLAEPRVWRVRVSVEKPGALRFARSVGVTIVRESPGGKP
jgi:D-erythro-7,8-dihydroneopterin triphosphate epimerase